MGEGSQSSPPQAPVLTDKASSDRQGAKLRGVFGVRDRLEWDTRKETDAASVGRAGESTHAAFDGQALSRNRPGRQSGYVGLRDETDANMRESGRKERMNETKQ